MIGALRHRLTLQTKARTPDGFGGFLVNWQDVAVLWAGMEESQGTFSPPGTTRRVRVRIRLRSDVRPGQRFQMNSRTLLIENVTDGRTRGRMLMCDCVEEVAIS